MTLTKGELTQTLKSSIEYEKGKRSVNNLLNHKPADLSVVVDVLTKEIKELEEAKKSRLELIDISEDMSESYKMSLRSYITETQNKIENLCAWRMIFLSAWHTVVNKKLKKA